MFFKGKWINKPVYPYTGETRNVPSPSQPNGLFGKRSCVWDGPSPSCPGKGAETQPHSLWFSAPSDQKGWWEHLKAVQPSSPRAEIRVGTANSLQQSQWTCSGRELGVQVGLVKTTKSFTRFRAAPPTAPGQGNKFVALLIADYNLQPAFPGNLNRTHKKLRSPSNSLAHGVPWTDGMAHGFTCRAKPRKG